MTVGFTPYLALPLVGGGDFLRRREWRRMWIPAFAGMTVELWRMVEERRGYWQGFLDSGLRRNDGLESRE